jgi:hypothetical protein
MYIVFLCTPYLRVYLFVNNFFDSIKLKQQLKISLWELKSFLLFLCRHPYCKYYYFYLFNGMTLSPLKNVLRLRVCSKKKHRFPSNLDFTTPPFENVLRVCSKKHRFPSNIDFTTRPFTSRNFINNHLFMRHLLCPMSWQTIDFENSVQLNTSPSASSLQELRL